MTEAPGELVLSEPIQAAGTPHTREIDLKRESARGRLVGGLVGILGAAVIAFPICAAFVDDERWPRVDAQLHGIITGLIGLVGVAVGWYFGSERR